jgi:hypothetical protein
VRLANELMARTVQSSLANRSNLQAHLVNGSDLTIETDRKLEPAAVSDVGRERLSFAKRIIFVAQSQRLQAII